MASPWVQKVAGSPGLMVADANEVRRALEVFADPDHGCELMALTTGVSKTRVGDDLDALVLAAETMPAGIGVYFRINPVPAHLTKAAADRDVLARRWIYIDADPVKQPDHKNDPATDDEKERTREVMESVNEFRSGLGWPAPVITDSGNGFGLFFRVDLPNDDLSKALVKRVLQRLHKLFSCDKGTIDPTTYNAGRLAKLPGTWAKKGEQSENRPHRPCRLLYVPDAREPVSIEALQETAGSEDKPPIANGTYPPSPPSPPSPPKSDPFIRRVGADGDAAYGKRALDAESARVFLAQPGTRNNALNRAAFSLGQLVAGGVLTEAEVVSRLAEAARRCGLQNDPGCGEAGIRSTIARAILAGKDEPRKPPEKVSPRANPHAKASETPRNSVKLPETGVKPESDSKPLTVCLSTVAPLKVEWLIRDRIPKRFVTVFAGRTAVGKSFLTSDLIARLSVGHEIPFAGGECFTPGGTLILSEDSLEYVLVPRLLNAGADMTRIHAMTWEAMARYNLADTDMLSSAIAEIPQGVSLVLIDPPTNFLDSIDEHKNAEVRQVVMRVVEWAMTRDLAVIFILHVNKAAKGVEALNRVMGSVAWVTTARVAHAFCDDPNEDGQCLWVPLKTNVGKLAKAIAYRITPEENDQARVEWVAEVDTTANEAMGGEPRKPRDVVASEWLIEKFREKLEWPSNDLFEAANHEGVSRSAVFEAKRKLKLPRARQRVEENGDRTFLWWVPLDWPPLTDEDEEQ